MSISTRPRLALAATWLLATACSPGAGGGGDDGGGDDDGPIDACPCPTGDGGNGGDGTTPPAGCEGMAGAAAQPFANHGRAYAAGSILPSHLPADQLDDAVRDFYDAWKPLYLKAGCGTGRWYVESGHSDRLTVSEAHGYGMLILVYMAGHEPNARTMFDGMVRFYQDHPSDITPALMSWSQDRSCDNNDGANSATDGDLDIAYALLLADKQWSSGGTINYRAEAEAIIDAIRAAEVDASASYVRLGDWTSAGQFYDATRSSDFMPAHFASFAAATGDSSWTQIATRSYQIMQAVQTGFAPQTGLLPDFIASAATSPRPVNGQFLENPSDGSYSYNACRDPWRIAMDFLINGDTRAKAVAQRMTTWIKTRTGGDPAAILPGYSLAGNGLGGNYLDLAFVAPFGVAAMVDGGNQTWLNRTWDTVAGERDGGYYADTIAMLSLIAMSGNWWSPEAAPCP